MDVCKIAVNSLDHVPSYHGWPTVIRTRDNRLIAVCSGNRQKHVCPYGRVWMYISEDEGKTWNGPQILSHGPLDDRDAGICEAADGTLLVNYFTSVAAYARAKELSKQWAETAENISLKTFIEEHGFWMRRSTDGGKTWGEKFRTPVYSPHGPVLMKDGRLFFAGQKFGSPCGEMAALPEFCAAFSSDNGASWEIFSSIPFPEGQNPRKICELHGIEAPDGTLIVQYRNHNCSSPGETWQTESVDGGKSWSKPRFICNGYPTYLQIFGGDKVIMTYSYRAVPCGIRARVSEDSGRTWGDEIILYDGAGEKWDLGYPSTAEMADGSLFTLWYENPDKEAKLHTLHWKFTE